MKGLRGDQEAIMEVIVEGKAQGVNRKRTCRLLQIEERRVGTGFPEQRLRIVSRGRCMRLHALLPEERTAIVAIAKDETYVDDSHRVLTAKCVDLGSLAVSASTVYRVMRTEGLTTDRNGRSHRNGNSRKPDRPELPGRTSDGVGIAVICEHWFQDVSLSLCAS